jgi:hypothetical protein
VNWVERMTHGTGLDNAALGHRDFGRPQSALSILIVYQRQHACIGGRGFGPPAGRMMVDDVPQEVAAGLDERPQFGCGERHFKLEIRNSGTSRAMRL